MNADEHDCVGALLVRGDEVLLGRRAPDRAWLPGAWDLFGGHIEAGEDAAQALRRELAEELGIVPRQLSWLATLGADTPQSWRLQVFVVTAWDGEPHNQRPDEHSEVRWCTLSEACERLAGAHPEFARVLTAAFAAD